MRSGMRLTWLVFAVAALYGCGREDAPAPRAEAPVEQAKQAEAASDAGKPLNDQGLNEIVRTALQSESTLNTQKIDIETREGTVTLHGVVASEEQRERAGRIVGSVGGVRHVENKLAVDPAAAVGATGPTTPGEPPFPRPPQ
jgi:hypothetical protein